MTLFERILLQRKNSKIKIYSLHDPEEQCISKDKKHKKYEFGNKVFIIRSQTGVILVACRFLDKYNAHSIEPNLKQVRRLTGKKIKYFAGDRGHLDMKEVDIHRF